MRNSIKGVKEGETKARENMGHNTNKYQWIDCVSLAYPSLEGPVAPVLALILIVSMHHSLKKKRGTLGPMLKLTRHV